MEFDYVIVGAGSAGCVVANRLSEDPNIRVCLLEAGKKDKSPLIHMPAGVLGILPTKHVNWAFETVPQSGLNNRKGYQPRGKTLGGSSSINAMVYIRGHAGDYDEWAAMGNEGWAFKDVLPYFKKSENQERGGDDYHGAGGPLNVADLRSPNPISDAFFEAGAQVQLPRTDDFNGGRQEGLGPYQVTQVNGERCSAAKAFIAPAKDRPNLIVMTQAHAKKVLFEGKRATGVAVRVGKANTEIFARKEVILSAGAFQTPQLLLLSGVGPGEELKRHGLEVIHALPGVGKNLHDHIDFVTTYRSERKDLVGFSLAAGPAMMKAFIEYRKRKTGMLTSNYAESGAFLKTQPDLDRPDIQLHFVPAMVDDHGRKLHWGHGFSCHVCVLRPVSRGSVTLASADPYSPPKIDPNFFGAPEDMATMISGVKLMHRILDAPALDAYRGEPLYPMNAADDADIERAVRERADTVYHPVGSCKMGTGDDAVVDPQLRVHGLESLRVIDASVMPSVIGGNTNAPSIMIGEKASDMIKQNHV